MKVLHYYAVQTMTGFGPFESEQTGHKPTCCLIGNCVLLVVKIQATGTPPFRLVVPRDIIRDIADFNFPNGLIQLEIEDGKGENNYDPFDSAVIHFRDSAACIHARRRACSIEACVE